MMKNVKEEDKLIKNMVELIIVKFKKYWGVYNVVFTCDAILNLRIKLKHWVFYYEKLIHLFES